MRLTDIILQDIEQVRAYTLDLVDRIEYDEWFRQPKEGFNHIAWQVGHLAIVQYNLCLKRIRGVHDNDPTIIPIAEYARLFGKGSIPSSDPDDYPSPPEIRAVLDAVHDRVRIETRTLNDSQLEESCGPPHPLFDTKGGALRFCPKHEMLHTGQIALLRRLYGGDVLR